MLPLANEVGNGTLPPLWPGFLVGGMAWIKKQIKKSLDHDENFSKAARGLQSLEGYQALLLFLTMGYSNSYHHRSCDDVLFLLQRRYLMLHNCLSTLTVNAVSK